MIFIRNLKYLVSGITGMIGCYSIFQIFDITSICWKIGSTYITKFRMVNININIRNNSNHRSNPLAKNIKTKFSKNRWRKRIWIKLYDKHSNDICKFIF